MTEDNRTSNSPHAMADLARKVGQAIDDHANPSDESEATFPGWPLDATRDADLIARLQRGEGRAYQIRLQRDDGGKQWAVHDFAVSMDREVDALEQAAPPVERPDPDRPAYVRTARPHGPAANEAYGHIGVMAGRRLFEALLQGEQS